MRGTDSRRVKPSGFSLAQERLKDWLKENSLTVESRAHLITDAGNTIPGFSTAGEECVNSCALAFAWRLDEIRLKDRHGDLFTFQAHFVNWR